MKHGRYQEALADYEWILDHRAELNDWLAARMSTVLDGSADLATKFAPARDALRKRSEGLSAQIAKAAASNGEIDPQALLLFVRVNLKLRDEAAVFRTYAVVKARLPPDARLRWQLWVYVEEFLMEQRRYAEAAGDDAASTAAVRFYLGKFERVRTDHRVRHYIEYTIEGEAGVHFEALLGAGNISSSRALGEELVTFAPTGHTFAVLIRRARRVGAEAEAVRWRERAHKTLPASELGIVDEAATCVVTPPGT